MLFNPIIAMLHNVKEDKYHPIIFVEKPLPGPSSDDKPIRHKSMGHHTTGFSTREEALRDIDELMKREPMKKCLDEDKDIPWDGEDIPTLVKFFSDDGATILM